ncbi:MAG TPA: hypothetical protein VJB57_18095 [Dehalococcoidia bacterium]|nr:hypothetical protein [Dehalococcoidia bacterium]
MNDEPVTITNEFASVRIGVDRRGKGPRLMIEDASSGVAIYLDPLELQSLAWATHKDFAVFAAPQFREQAFDRVLGQMISGLAVGEAEAILRRLEAQE